jgi:hypothetical protein
MDQSLIDAETEERRKLERPIIMCYSTVFDMRTGDFTGYLLDIHCEGMRILSDKKIPLGERFNFRLDLPEFVFGKEHIRLRASCVWSYPDIAQDFYSTGFRMEYLSEEDRAIIDGINREYKLRN